MNKSRDEEEVYNNELSKYDNKIDFIQKEMNNINTSERNTIEEFQILIEILQNAGEKYRKGSYVQKRKITELFYTNIFVDNKKRLTFEVNP